MRYMRNAIYTIDFSLQVVLNMPARKTWDHYGPLLEDTRQLSWRLSEAETEDVTGKPCNRPTVYYIY